MTHFHLIHQWTGADLAWFMTIVLLAAPLLAWPIAAAHKRRARIRAARRQARYDMALAALAIADDGCGCRFWDNDGDRAKWQPCPEHEAQLLEDVFA